MNLAATNRIRGKELIKYSIVIYWMLFWLLNFLDKLIGGSHFLWVGKDRFALFERYFDSLALGQAITADIALIITAALEIFAFLFFVGALYHLIKKNNTSTHLWFFLGIILTLGTFTFFSIGDQFFGDHGELLEHGTYWLITLLSWFIFTHIDKINALDKFSIDKKSFSLAAILAIVLISITSFSIFHHNKTSFIERTETVDGIKIDNNKYKFSFPFLAGSKAFENSIANFKKEHPNLTINYIYTAPSPLRLGKSDGLIIYIQTEKK